MSRFAKGGVAFGGAVLAVGLLSGCGEVSTPKEHHGPGLIGEVSPQDSTEIYSLTPKERYGFEFLGKEVDEGGLANYVKALDDCLSGTPYDVNTVHGDFFGEGLEPEASITLDSPNVLRVVSRNPGAVILRLSGLNNPSQPLRPADLATRNTLEAYDCEAAL